MGWGGRHSEWNEWVGGVGGGILSGMNGSGGWGGHSEWNEWVGAVVLSAEEVNISLCAAPLFL